MSVVPEPDRQRAAGDRWWELDGVVPAAPPSVSVIIVHYRQPRELARTLAAIRRQTHAGPIEVIVVDDGSPDPLDLPDDIRLVRQDDDGNRTGVARNLGVSQATGEVLVFLDADTAPEPAYVERIARLPVLLPDAVVVGHRRHADFSSVDPEAPVEVAGPAHALPEPEWLAEGYRRSDDLRAVDERSYRFVISAVLACPRAFFLQAGGFAEQRGSYGGDDWEWANRAWLHGAAFAHVPGAVAWHDGPDWGLREISPQLRRAQKNTETVRLAREIAVPGARGHALRTAPAEIVARLPADLDAASAFVVTDALLCALPHATVLVPDGLLPVLDGDPRVAGLVAGDAPGLALPRLELELTAAALLAPDALRAWCGRCAAGAVGEIEVYDGRGVLARISSTRHRHRVARRGPGSGWPVLRERAESAARLSGPPDVEAYLGGWPWRPLR